MQNGDRHGIPYDPRAQPHKCEKSFIGIENLKNHFEQDQCDCDNLSDSSMNDVEYEDILAKIRNETEDI